MKKHILIVGGSSGVGFELAKHYIAEGHTVCITGRKNPDLENAQFEYFSITEQSVDLPQCLDNVVTAFPNVNTLIYAAGFLQRGHIEDLSDGDLLTMTNVGLLAPMLLIARLKRHASSPLKIMLITSSSQYTPRPLEPAYCATKAGLAMLAAVLVRDQGVGKVLVAAPSGIDTPFWSDTDEATETMLDPRWVADQIVALSSGPFKFKEARLLRNPARVEVVEMLDNTFQSLLNSV